MQLTLKHIFVFVLLLIIKDVDGQFIVDSTAIDTMNQIKDLDPIEANFLFSYYEQDGTKSPVTGGIGDEALKDMVGNISVKVPIKKNLNFNFSGGVDVYTSASTDNINNEYGLYAETSASYRDIHVHGDMGVEISKEKRRLKYGFGVGGSNEFDVRSYNGNAFISKLSKNRNTLFYLKGLYYNDTWKMIYPSELRWKYDIPKVKKNGKDEDGGDDNDYDSKIRNTYTGIFSIEQDITPRLKGSIISEVTYQDGLLSTPFHRVYFRDNIGHDIEKLPDQRLKLPIGVRLNYYLSNYMIVRMYYRYYYDDFGINAHTASIELPIKPVPSFAVSPFYRFHTQTASKYFDQFGFHSIDDPYYTSDFDLANIRSDRIGMELRYSPFILKKGDPSKKKLMFKKVAIRASKYFRNRENELILKSYIVALELKFTIE